MMIASAFAESDWSLTCFRPPACEPNRASESRWRGQAIVAFASLSAADCCRMDQR